MRRSTELARPITQRTSVPRNWPGHWRRVSLISDNLLQYV